MKLLIAFLFCISFSLHAQQPEIKDGLDKFVKENIIYPSYSRYNCIQGTIKIAFKVNAKGEVSNARVENGFGIDLDEEALRLIKMTNGKWIVPASHDVNSLFVVPVNFILSGYNCERVTKAEIAKSIQGYIDQGELLDMVSNFYKNKEKGTFKSEDELKVTRVKEDLRIDDSYLEQKIEDGKKKYKQGDKQGACKDFNFVKYMGSNKADEYLSKYCN